MKVSRSANLLLLLLAPVLMATANNADAKPKKKVAPVLKTETTTKKTVAVESKTGKTTENGIPLPFYVYSEKSAASPYVPSGWMGDYGDLKINDTYKENPYDGLTCIQVIYSALKTNGAGWAGIYWQHPANNWGSRQGGFNLKGAKKFVFWARGAQGGEVIAEFKIGGINSQDFPGDSDSASIGPITLTPLWQQYEIDLAGKDLSHIIGGFAFAASSDSNAQGFTIYLDNLCFE